MGAIPSDVKAQSAAGTPPTADYHGKKNIYICVYYYNSLSMDICAGVNEVKLSQWVTLPTDRVTFCWWGNLLIGHPSLGVTSVVTG